MHRFLLCSLFVLPHLLPAQDFVPAQFPVEGNRSFEKTALSSIAFADIDGDSDQDILITGLNDSGVGIAKFYTNNSRGKFTEEAEIRLEGTARNAVAFADIDEDNDQDLLITGLTNSSNSIARLYTNNGEGKFTAGSYLKDVLYGSVAFADIDGDNDQDLMITGESMFGELVAQLYVNNGKGKFTGLANTPFKGVNFSSIAFADVDGDNDQDLLITGRDSSLVRIAQLYINDGKGGFTEKTSTPFEGVSASSIAFADVDGDNDQDLLITGLNNALNNISKLYTNNGKGGFTEITDAALEGVFRSSVAFADIDGDNDQDLLITGQNSSSTPRALLYINDGQGRFAQMEEALLVLEGVYFGSSAFADVDGDSDQDLLITGFDSANTPTSTLYINTFITLSIAVPYSASWKTGPQFFPNPSIHSRTALSYFTEDFGELFISLSDAAGRMLLQQQMTVSEGENTIPLDCAGLPKGTYIVELKQGDRSTSTKLVIQ